MCTCGHRAQDENASHLARLAAYELKKAQSNEVSQTCLLADLRSNEVDAEATRVRRQLSGARRAPPTP